MEWNAPVMNNTAGITPKIVAKAIPTPVCARRFFGNLYILPSMVKICVIEVQLKCCGVKSSIPQGNHSESVDTCLITIEHT